MWYSRRGEGRGESGGQKTLSRMLYRYRRRINFPEKALENIQKRNETAMKQYTTILFDLDGTLLNTLEDLTDSTNYALEQFSMPRRTIEEVRRFVGNGIAKLIERAVPEGTEGALTEQVLACFKEHYGVHCADKTAPYPGVISLMKTLGKEGYKMAIVSNKAHEAVCELEEQYFKGLVDAVIGEQEAKGIRKKPAPDMVYKVLEEFCCTPQEALYIGDSEVDRATAAHGGLDCLLVSWGFRERAMLETLNAAGIADSAEEVLGFIRGV